MNASRKTLAVILPLLLLAGCVTAPVGPSVMALPGTGKTFDQFRADDMECRQYAQYQSGGVDANSASTDSAVRSAAIGTAVGAVAGAAFGGSRGAGIGAGTGLLMGGLVGTDAARASGHNAQRSYDNAYVQCMYGKGEQVPVPSGMRHGMAPAPAAVAPPPPPPPPPPVNYPPPPGTR